MQEWGLKDLTCGSIEKCIINLKLKYLTKSEKYKFGNTIYSAYRISVLFCTRMAVFRGIQHRFLDRLFRYDEGLC